MKDKIIHFSGVFSNSFFVHFFTGYCITFRTNP